MVTQALVGKSWGNIEKMDEDLLIMTHCDFDFGHGQVINGDRAEYV